jgi:hypothetical protein
MGALALQPRFAGGAVFLEHIIIVGLNSIEMRYCVNLVIEQAYHCSSLPCSALVFHLGLRLLV